MDSNTRRRVAVCAGIIACAIVIATPVVAEDFRAWPLLTDPFPSTGGGGIMIEGYAPVVTGRLCTTAFVAREPNGTGHRALVEFDAVETQGGILCQNGRWRSLDSEASGTTPFRVFIADGVRRGQ
jgi:hypothetical protein